MKHNSANMDRGKESGRTISVPTAQFIDGIRRELESGLSVEICCRGNSMNPFLVDRRDSIVLSPCDSSALRKGDVVLGLSASGHWVIHRIVRLNPILLNGDGNYVRSCEHIPEGQVYAKMTAYVRKGRRAGTDSLQWRLWSSFWNICGRLAIGSWSLRRIILGLWRRCHRSLVHRP